MNWIAGEIWIQLSGLHGAPHGMLWNTYQPESKPIGRDIGPREVGFDRVWSSIVQKNSSAMASG